MNDPYAHLTPKPLDQHVPGAWNFVEPNPNERPTPKLDALIQASDMAFARPRISLSPEAREKIAALFPYNPTDITVDDEDYWERFAETLLEVLMPVRYIVGMDPAAGDPARP